MVVARTCKRPTFLLFLQILEKVDKSNVLIKKVQDLMKGLAKPLGSKVEDAEAAIEAYQVPALGLRVS